MPILQSLLNRQSKKPMVVNCQEVFNVWDLLNAKYLQRQQVLIWKTYAHDPDLQFLLNQVSVQLDQQIDELETLAKQININGPDTGVVGVNTSANSEIIRDEFIGQALFFQTQEAAELPLRAMRSTTTNDQLRRVFYKHAHQSIDAIDKQIPYLRLKGWINTPPLYANIPTGVTEQLDTGEAFHLWDHLTFRYDNVRQTEIYLCFAHDAEFNFLLQQGIQRILKQQIEKLEKECLRFGLPLPKHQPAPICSLSHREAPRYCCRSSPAAFLHPLGGLPSRWKTTMTTRTKRL